VIGHFGYWELGDLVIWLLYEEVIGGLGDLVIWLLGDWVIC